MSDNYTPTTEQVREAATSYHGITWTGAEFDRWLSSELAAARHAGRVEQREADAAIAETRYFGGGTVGAANRWGAKQAAAAIRSTEIGEN